VAAPRCQGNALELYRSHPGYQLGEITVASYLVLLHVAGGALSKMYPGLSCVESRAAPVLHLVAVVNHFHELKCLGVVDSPEGDVPWRSMLSICTHLPRSINGTLSETCFNTQLVRASARQSSK
jgi:hypothetical protein